jgi:16S rRNA (guanine527-N7)-methyltransferase
MTNFIPDWLDVSRETVEKLEAFATEVARWTPAINLVSKSSVPDIWQRHILDSAQIYQLGNTQEKWVDIGSGGGFPGIVMAIMGVKDVVLVESDQRKSTFLRHVARQLSLSVTIIPQRIDAISPLAAQTVSARALASLTALLAHVTPHLAPNGRAVFPKGKGLEVEMAEAMRVWDFDVTRVPSKTDPEAAIAVIENIRRR